MFTELMVSGSGGGGSVKAVNGTDSFTASPQTYTVSGLTNIEAVYFYLTNYTDNYGVAYYDSINNTTRWACKNGANQLMGITSISGNTFTGNWNSAVGFTFIAYGT